MKKVKDQKAAKRAKIHLILMSLFLLSTLIWAGARIVAAVQFELGCASFMKRAAGANTVELAKEELGKALTFARENNLTEGTVSIFLQNPSNDMGFWYRNMTAAHDELVNMPEDASQLERTNVLMKLRESLTDNTDGSSSVIVPSGISIYPNNVAYFWWSTISIVGVTVFFFLWAVAYEKASGKKILTTNTLVIQSK